MKKYVTLIVVILITNNMVFGQKQYQEVIYLKDGTVLYGVIIEQIPNLSITIQTADDNVFTYPIDEVERIAKEEIIKERKSDQPLENRKGHIGFGIGPNISLSTNRYQLIPKFDWNLLDVGYRIDDQIGIAGSVLVSQELFDLDFFSYWGLLFGPTLSLKQSGRVNVDIRSMIGVCFSKERYYGSSFFFLRSIEGKPITSTFFNLGIMFKFRVGKKAAFTLNIDYLHANPKFEFQNLYLNDKINDLSIRSGFVFLLK